MMNATYQTRRGEIEAYFDRTALDTWAKLTSDAPVSGIRATVRAGRDRMRETLLGWLPGDLAGRSLLDAGCGTGALSVAAAQRGAHVTAIDISPELVRIARDRLPYHLGAGAIDFFAGDMIDPPGGTFDHAICMDTLIHYHPKDAVRMLAQLSRRTRYSLLFTFPPRTPLLSLMHVTGKLFPKSDRSPRIVPVAPARLRAWIEACPELADFRIGRTERVACGFYTSQALELVRCGEALPQ